MDRRISDLGRFANYGRVVRIAGLVIEAVGLDVGMGALCRVSSLTDARAVLAEVCGFQDGGVLLMSLGELEGIHAGAMVQPLGRSFGVQVGPGLLGRVLDGIGNPIDGGHQGRAPRWWSPHDPTHPS